MGKRKRFEFFLSYLRISEPEHRQIWWEDFDLKVQSTHFTLANNDNNNDISPLFSFEKHKCRLLETMERSWLKGIKSQ